MSTSPLRRLLLINGTALTLQGLIDIALGRWVQLGAEVSAGADSDVRFLGGMLVGAGILFIALSRRAQLPVPAVQVLAGGMLLGVGGRLLSMLVIGAPGPLTLVLTIVEAVTTLILLTFATLAARGARAANTDTLAAAPAAPAAAPAAAH